MKLFKRILCVALCIIMMQSFTVGAFATEVTADEENPDADAFFAFGTGTERMESNGDFTFSFNSELTSSRFTAKEDKITVTITVWLRDIDDTPTWTDPWFPLKDANKTMSVTLYKAGEGEVDSYTVSANDKKNTLTFTGIEVGAKYYMVFESVTTLGARMRFDGKGNVSNVTVG